jgi:hypothetical protein
MNNLNLPYPKQIGAVLVEMTKVCLAGKAVPANLVCGVYEAMDEQTRMRVQTDAANYQTK